MAQIGPSDFSLRNLLIDTHLLIYCLVCSCQYLFSCSQSCNYLVICLSWFVMCSAQRSAVRVRSLTEELEETHQAFKEAREKASRTQNSCSKLVCQTQQSHSETLCCVWLILYGNYLHLSLFFFWSSEQ